MTDIIIIISMAFLGIYVFYVGFKNFRLQLFFYKNSLETKAVVLRSDSHGFLYSRRVHITLEYAVNDHRYTDTYVSINCFKPKKGKELTVRYLPEIPQKVQITGIKFWLDALAVAFIGAFIIATMATVCFLKLQG